MLSCAKEFRPLPQQGFTCCLAMDGVKILASGFQANEKVRCQCSYFQPLFLYRSSFLSYNTKLQVEIGKLVTAMGGVLHTKASLDVTFVIVKNVLAAKYKVVCLNFRSD